MRKFYIIAHNPNSVWSAIAALEQGANALEPDITFAYNGCNPDFYVFDKDDWERDGTSATTGKALVRL